MSESYRLVRSSRRTIALIVESDGSLVVRAPRRAPLGLIQEFVQSKADWIRRKQAQARKTARATAREFLEGEKFWYLGALYPLTIVPHQRNALEFRSAFRLAQSARARARQAFVRWYSTEARRLVVERLRWYAGKYGFEWAKVRVTSARTRWGSCSRAGTLSFPWRLAMAPPEVIDYVVVHELVHLKVRNHSPAFWAEVGAILPDYKRRLAWLKKNGRFLTLGE